MITLALCICIIVSIIILLPCVLYWAVGAEARRKTITEHHELSWRLTNSGSETHSLKRAKDSYARLSASYDGVKDSLSDNARSCYEDDIELIRDNAEAIAEEKWSKKADSYLLKIEMACDAITSYDFLTLEKAYKSKGVLLRAYDGLFDWTRKCYEDNKHIWKNVNIWTEAKEEVKSTLECYGFNVSWTNPSNHQSVRQQLIAALDKQIEAIRPEYQRKMKLKSLILQKIANKGTIQRSHLLKMHFDGFIKQEISACYNGLVKEHAVIESKQGSVYFVVLSDGAAKKYSPKKETNQNPAKEKPQPERTEGAEKEDSMIAPRTKLLYRELIRHFDEEGIEYVDKTTNGGGLYFFSETEAENLKKKDYPVFFTEKGTKGTGHRPAWYIKL